MDMHAEHAPDTGQSDIELSLKAAHAFVQEALSFPGEDGVIHLASKVERGVVERSLLEALLAAGRFNPEETPFVEQVLARTSGG